MTAFDSEIKTHSELARNVESFLEEYSGSIETPELAEEVADETDTGLSKDYIYSLINDGSDWIISHKDVVIRTERGGSGGSATKHWRGEE